MYMCIVTILILITIFASPFRTALKVFLKYASTLQPHVD